MFTLRTFILVASIALTTSFCRADLDFTSGVNSYRLVTTAGTWDVAEADAVAKGGHLVHINSSTENADVYNAIRTLVTTTANDGGGSKYAWIGGKETTEGSYAWSDSLATNFWTGGSAGTAVSYHNWGRLSSPYGGPEPDNYNFTQNRAAMAVQNWPSFATTGTQIGNASQWNDINGTNSLQYVIEWTPWQFWQKTYFFGADLTNVAKSGPSANPDGDALVNLLEFAFGTAPTTRNSSLVAESGGSIVSLGAPVPRVIGGNSFALFARRKNFSAAALTYTVQFSVDLASWTDSNATPDLLADNGTMQVVSIPFPILSGKLARYFRVRVAM